MERIVAFVILCLILILLTFLTAGCAALPMPFQPHTENNYNVSEGVFVGLTAVDTLQTVQIAKHPACYYEADPTARFLYGSAHPTPARVIGTNLIAITTHTVVSSWLDERASKENARYDREDLYGFGPWAMLRFVFHAVSLADEGWAVTNNFNRGIRLNSTECPR